MKLLLFFIAVIFPTALLANNRSEKFSCFNEHIDAKKLSQLPSEIQESLEDIFDERYGKLGDTDSYLKQHMRDFAKLGISENEYSKLPRNKFQIGFKLKKIYIVFIKSADSQDSSSFGYRLEKQSGKYNLYPSYYFEGPVCSILTAIQNNVRNPSDLPKNIVDALKD
jgi:hypothetical protein